MKSQRIAIIVMMVAAVSIAAILTWQALDPTVSAETCNEPCVVEFPSGTQEDDFKIDWRDGKLYVSKLPAGHD